MLTRRSVADLAKQALAARAGGLGHDGMGFAVADSLASRFGLSAGGHKVANLPLTISIERAVGSLLAVTDRGLWLNPHIEELFTTSVYVAGESGALDVYAFYCGPSGLALGEPTHLAPFHAFDAQEVARALAAALMRVTPLDWCVEADSDFGVERIGLRDGQRITKKSPPFVHTGAWDPGALTTACVRLEEGGGDSVADFVALAEARAMAFTKARESSDLARADRAMARVWTRMFDVVDRELSQHHTPVSAELERAANVLAFPPTRALVDAIGAERTKRVIAIVEAHHAKALASG